MSSVRSIPCFDTILKIETKNKHKFYVESSGRKTTVQIFLIILLIKLMI